MTDHKPVTTESQSSFQTLVELLTRARRISVLTGAGCSTSSGIPDYRDEQGDWKRSQPIQYQAFVSSPSARARYWSRSMVGWPIFKSAEPGRAHQSLAALGQLVEVDCLITQNVDGLHQRAGSGNVLELHGALDQVVCLSCGSLSSRAVLQERLEALNPTWAEATGTPAPDGDVDLESGPTAQFRVPGCELCQGQLKPDVVFFGENVPRKRVQSARAAVGRSDMLLVIGSSLMVFSGFRFVRQAAQIGVPVAIINRGVTRGDSQASVKLNRDCGAALDELVDAITNGGKITVY